MEGELSQRDGGKSGGDELYYGIISAARLLIGALVRYQSAPYTLFIMWMELPSQRWRASTSKRSTVQYWCISVWRVDSKYPPPNRIYILALLP